MSQISNRLREVPNATAKLWKQTNFTKRIDADSARGCASAKRCAKCAGKQEKITTDSAVARGYAVVGKLRAISLSTLHYGSSFWSTLWR